MVHAMSLIHDDLPAMDNAEVRRGKPANHKRYGEALAILAGDALLAHAFGWIAERASGVAPERLLAVIRELSAALSIHGVVEGQGLELAMAGCDELPDEAVRRIARLKTAALFRAAAVCGARLAGASACQLGILARFAERLGLAFQTVDDVLDVAGSEEWLGKPTGRDATANLRTQVDALGIAGARRHSQALLKQAQEELARFGPAADPLLAIAGLAVNRQR
jgi:geranylgeranyl diphosphate synthase type II